MMLESMPLATAFCAARAPIFFGYNSPRSIAPEHPSAYTASALVKKYAMGRFDQAWSIF
jgi:hypothetical protein